MKNWWGLVLVLLLVPLMSASDLGVSKKADCIELYQLCDNCTYVNLTSVTFPNKTIYKIGEFMEKDGVDYNYTFCATDIIGDYSYKVCGDKDGSFICENLDFEITGTGYALTQQNATVFLGLMALVIFLFVVVIYTIPKIPDGNTMDDSGAMIKVGQLKYLRKLLYVVSYLLVMALMFLGSNVAYAYLGTTMFADLLFAFYRIMFIMMTPMLVIWFIWIFYSIFKDKEMQKLLDRGVDFDGRL